MGPVIFHEFLKVKCGGVIPRTGFDEAIDGNGLVDMENTICIAMNDADNIHFNVEGMTIWRGIVDNPDPSGFLPPSTDCELATVMRDTGLKSKTTLYDGPGNPTKCS